ncbi:MAG: hypothetical protein PVI30_02765 [Myxococcales bacterium]|jgi:hypothetical protein
MVEAVILVPFLGLVLLAVIFVASVHREAGEARLLARRCAWQYALEGCVEGAIPDGCEQVLSSPAWRPPEDAETRDKLDAARDMSDASEVDETGTLEDLLDMALRTVLGEIVVARARRSVTQPFSTGDGSGPGDDGPPATRHVGGHAALLCNSRPIDVAGALSDAFRALMP